MQPKRSPTGIRARHSRSCRTAQGARCNCDPSYEAWVFLKREGRKVRKTFSGSGALTAAKLWRADALSAAGKGRLRAPAPTTVRQACEAWLAAAQAGTVRNRNGDRYKPSALRGYERSLKMRVLPALGDNRLSELRRTDVQDFADRLLADGLDPSTIQNTLDPLRAVYRRAIRRDQVAVNPTAGLELARAAGRRERIAAPAEAGALLAALPNADRALWATAMYAGLRRGELRALRWADVDLDAGELRVSRTWDSQEGEQVGGKSRAATRTVPLLAPLRVKLREHQVRSGHRGDELVFGTTDEQPFEPSTVRRRALAAWGWELVPNPKPAGPRRVWAKARPDALEPIGLHECRHTCASLFIAAGANPKVVQRVMGHATVGMTFDVYGHLFPGGLAEAAAKVDAVLAQVGAVLSEVPDG